MKYQILGGNMPVVVCHLEEGECLMMERGAMSWMSPNMQMETQGGGIGKMFGRAMSGESIFLNKYTSVNERGMISLASSFPGSIRAVEITPEKPYIVQKTGFLACTAGVELSMHFRKKIGAGFFGGEGFIMQKLSGSGIAFIEIDGHAMEYDLQEGQKMILDTGYLAAMTGSCNMDIQTVKGLKNIMFGGEGLFNTVVTGPGHIIVQTMPMIQFASSIKPYIIPKNQ